MASIAQELKQLAARITTAAGDVASVKGQSISEVLDYTFKNLNVDENGALVVSEIVEPTKPSVGGGNLLKAPITISPSDNQVLLLDYSLNLEEGKSYKVIGTKGENNTAFEFTCIAVGNAITEEGVYIGEPDGMAIYDKVTMDMETGDPIASENNCVITTVSDQIPLTITSITLVEEASGGNLLSAPITHSEPIEDTAVLSLDFSVGIEDGKSYTFRGTRGTDNTPFEVTALAEKPNDSDFTKMLTDERQGLIVAMVYTDETEEVGLGVIILDKCYIDFDNEISEYNENKAMVLLMTEYSTEEEGLMIPFTLNSITEA